MEVKIKDILCFGMSTHALFFFSFTQGTECTTTSLKWLTSKVSKIDHLVIMQGSAEKPWMLAFMWMPLVKGNPTPNTDLTDRMHPCNSNGTPCRIMCPNTLQKLLRNVLRSETTSSMQPQIPIRSSIQVWSKGTPSRNPQYSKDLTPTPWCQTPKDTHKGSVSVPWRVSAKSDPRWGFHGLEFCRVQQVLVRIGMLGIWGPELTPWDPNHVPTTILEKFLLCVGTPMMGCTLVCEWVVLVQWYPRESQDQQFLSRKLHHEEMINFIHFTWQGFYHRSWSVYGYNIPVPTVPLCI